MLINFFFIIVSFFHVLFQKITCPYDFETHIISTVSQNFANFQQSNNIPMQKSCSFKKYHLQEKFTFQQLLANYADLRRNKSVLFMGGKNAFKNISCGKNSYFEN